MSQLHCVLSFAYSSLPVLCVHVAFQFRLVCTVQSNVFSPFLSELSNLHDYPFLSAFLVPKFSPVPVYSVSKFILYWKRKWDLPCVKPPWKKWKKDRGSSIPLFVAAEHGGRTTTEEVSSIRLCIFGRI